MLVATFLYWLLVDYCCARNFSSSAIFSISFYFYGRRWNFILGLFLEDSIGVVHKWWLLKILTFYTAFYSFPYHQMLNLSEFYLFGVQLSLQIWMTQATLKNSLLVSMAGMQAKYYCHQIPGNFLNKIPQYLCLKNL